VRSAGLRANLGHLGNPRLLVWTCGRAAAERMDTAAFDWVS